MELIDLVTVMTVEVVLSEMIPPSLNEDVKETIIKGDSIYAFRMFVCLFLKENNFCYQFLLIFFYLHVVAIYFVLFVIYSLAVLTAPYHRQLLALAVKKNLIHYLQMK